MLPSPSSKPMFVVFTLRGKLIRPKTMKKILPKIMSDEEAESLLSADLSEYLTPENFKANFTPVSFEFASK
jgi:predicted DNA binding CopG/RHH family protein